MLVMLATDFSTFLSAITAGGRVSTQTTRSYQQCGGERILMTKEIGVMLLSRVVASKYTTPPNYTVPTDWLVALDYQDLANEPGSSYSRPMVPVSE